MTCRRKQTSKNIDNDIKKKPVVAGPAYVMTPGGLQAGPATTGFFLIYYSGFFLILLLQQQVSS